MQNPPQVGHIASTSVLHSQSTTGKLTGLTVSIEIDKQVVARDIQLRKPYFAACNCPTLCKSCQQFLVRELAKQITQSLAQHTKDRKVVMPKRGCCANTACTKGEKRLSLIKVQDAKLHSPQQPTCKDERHGDRT